MKIGGFGTDCCSRKLRVLQLAADVDQIPPYKGIYHICPFTNCVALFQELYSKLSSNCMDIDVFSIA